MGAEAAYVPLIIGALAAAGGTYANYEGAKQSERSQQRTLNQERAYQDTVQGESDAKQKLLLDEQAPTAQIAAQAPTAATEAAPLKAVTDSVTAAAGDGSTPIPQAIQGRVIANDANVGGQGNMMAQQLAKIRAKQLGQQNLANATSQFGIDRNRLAQKAMSRSSFLPSLMATAAKSGSGLKTLGTIGQGVGSAMMFL
jgi:hypothetical protein